MTSRFVSSIASHVGHRRAVQEDAVLARPEIGLWAVADGMGGHHRGDLASRRIVETLSALRPPDSASSFLADVRAGLSAVHQDLNRVEPANGRTGGATCVVLMVWHDQFACLWAGDSRLYRLRDRALIPLTRDHSRVRELVDAGEISEASARLHPQASIVTRAIGAGTRFDLETVRGAIRRYDRLILCSDGVTSVLSDAEIRALADNSEADVAAEVLVGAVLAAGAPDNASAIVVTAL
jgi:serine/threonine protein phosphatase PrpC